MDKFNCTLRGYDKNEVNAFIDQIIEQVENMVNQIEDKNKQIVKLEKEQKKSATTIKKLSSKISQLNKEIDELNKKEKFGQEFDQTIDNLNKAKQEAKKIIDDADLKSQRIIEEAQDNADVIINECLMSAKKKEMELNNLKGEIKKLKQKKETLYYETKRESAVGESS